jgi:hypothetical protein
MTKKIKRIVRKVLKYIDELKWKNRKVIYT